MKKIVTCFLILNLILSSLGSIPIFADTYYDYTDNEIFVMYINGDTTVIKCSDRTQLEEKINELNCDPDVYLYQPNYSYSSLNLSLNDSLLKDQWALYNDGTFRMEEKKNDYPVFNEPFGEKLMPGQWIMPDFYGIPGGIFFRYNSF